ncbi:IclR family transcriptional regulator [Paenibacillus sp. tmac-D7]|uniref:IclR family transcriptional regulator n=1 Tax=Paenibacillus sp. tmac-D7 TaxID=2591462 RepID=UPI0011424200|nr:IclR family transcriptional regulator [Paenibacillus sp. tmac-D7]
MLSTVSNALQILKLFQNQKNMLSLTSISKEMGLNKSTSYRLLSTLVEAGFVYQDPKSRLYGLGSMSFELGGLFLSRIDVHNASRGRIEELSQITKETVHLAILDQNEILFLNKINSPTSTAINTRVGLRVPGHITGLGKVLLAFQNQTRMEESILTKGVTGKNKEALLQDLTLTRKRGYAIDNEGYQEGVTCIAVPIWDYTRTITAAISISGPSFRMNKDLNWLVMKTLEVGQQISVEMGY